MSAPRQYSVDEQSAALAFTFYGFSLEAFDEWLHAPDWKPEQRDAVLELRARAVDSHRQSNEDAQEAWVMLLDFMWRMNVREAQLRPLAALGIKTGQAQRARRKGKPAADPADTTRDARLRAFHARMASKGADATSATAAEFGLSTRRVRQILRG